MSNLAVDDSNWTSWRRLFGDRSWLRAMHDLKRLASKELPEQLARRLIRAWGDDSTAVSPEYLAHCYKAASSATGTIVDFGAGVTTIVMTWACRDRAASVLAIDCDRMRRRRVMTELARLSLRAGYVRLTTVTARDDVPWLAVDFHAVRRPIAFAACHRVRGLGDPREGWRRIVEPALPDPCEVFFDPV